MWRARRVLVAAACACLSAAACAWQALPHPAVLLVGSYHGIPGQYSSIQAAVDAARPGDWVLIGPGDYHETGNRVPPGAVGDDTAGAAVLVTTPNIWIRGMDRNAVVLDGTKPGRLRAAPRRPTRTSARSIPTASRRGETAWSCSRPPVSASRT